MSRRASPRPPSARFTQIALAAALGACADSEELEPPGASSVRFAIADGPLDFAAIPFPSELYRDDAGAIAIGALPTPRTDDPLFVAIRELLAARDGFCTTCNVTFTIDEGLLASSVPPSAAPGDETTLDDPVVLVDVDEDSPDFGRTFPLRVQWQPDRGLLSVRPARGFALHRGRRYAAIVTHALRGADDLPVGPAPAFAQVRSGDVGDDPTLARATDVLEPTLAALENLGLERERVAGLAAFTTEDPTGDLTAIRAAVQLAAVPIATVDAMWDGAALDELLGTPAMDGPGIDLAPAAGTDGTAAIAHATTSLVVAGRFAAPRFVGGSGTDVGATVRDGAGRPLAPTSEDVPFVLVVPAGVDVSRLPVVVSHHGFNASRTTGFALTDTAGRAGFAVLAIDAFQHGERAESAQDQLHAMRGDVAGADGFAETSKLDVSSRVFGLGGTASDMVLFPGYPLGAFEQFAADSMSAIRFARQGDLAAIRAAHPSLAALAFDPERIAFVGNSMGAVVGTAIVAVEPDVHAVVLDVMPGSIVETLAESGEFRPLMETLLLPLLGVEDSFDEVERAMLFDPVVDLFRWVLEPVDPLALAPYVVLDRVAAGAPDVLVQLAAHDEVAAPGASESVVAAAGIAGSGTFELAAVEPAMLPVVGTAAVRFDPAMHGMLEVSQQSSRWADPLVPPLQERPSPQTIANPIAAVHGQIETFLRSFRESGRATIVP
jgi:hypothetical protein